MANFKRKAIIEAVQFNGSNGADLLALLIPSQETVSGEVTINDSIAGSWNLAVGDWLVKENGTITKMTNALFEEYFEAVV